MKRRAIGAIIFVISAGIACAQSAAAQTGSTQTTVVRAGVSLPPEVFQTFGRYEELFRRARLLQQMATTLTAQGKDNGGPLHELKRQAALTGAEEAALNAAAIPVVTAFDSGEKAAQAMVAQFMANNPPRTRMPVALQQQIEDQRSADIQVVLDAVQRLQAGFGEARFQNLDNYVRSAIPGPQTVAPKRGTPPVKPPR